ncbi:MAG: MFS transporter [Anaerolineae bacterium]
MIANTIDKIADSIGANRTVLALSVARLGDAVGNSILFVVIPLYVAKLPAPWFPIPETVLVGLLISLYGLTNALLQPFVGAWIDRVSRRKPFIQAGLVLMAIGTLAFVFAGRFSALLFIRGLQGIGVALTIPASLALMASATEKRTRGGSMGVYTSMRMVGFAIGPLIGGFLHDHVSFNAAFYTGAAFIFLGLIFVQVWVHETPDRSRAQSAGAFRVLDREFLTGGILGLAIATFLMASSFSMMSALEKQFNQRLGQGALGFGLAFSALMVSRLVAQVPLGWLSDRIGRKPLIIGGLVLMAPATVLLGLAATTLQLTGFRVFQGVASAAIAAPAFALAADLSRSGGEGRQLSIVTTGFGLGIALGPLIAGVLATVIFELPFIIGGALTLLGAWVVYRYVPETIHRRASSAAQVRGAAQPADSK